VTTPGVVQSLYRDRFGDHTKRRSQVWAVLCSDYFQVMISDPATATVVDLGCGYGEFINHVKAARRFAIDINPDSERFLEEGVVFIQCPAQDVSAHVNQAQLIFSSNFLEHLPDKASVESVLASSFSALKEGGKLVLLGPNIRFLAGRYWDFWDHHVPLSEKSLTEVLRATGYNIRLVLPRFLPYTMSGRRPPRAAFVKMYLRFRIVWPLFGRQFLIVAEKPTPEVG
jgi:dolichol-phosphate mannosyltransferase